MTTPKIVLCAALLTLAVGCEREPEPAAARRPFKRVALFELRGVFCQKCGDVRRSLKNISQAHPDRIEVLELHDPVTYSKETGLGSRITTEYMRAYSFGGFPTLLVEYAQSATGGKSEEEIRRLLAPALESEAAAAIGLRSDPSADKQSVTVTVRIESQRREAYFLSLVLVEDRVAWKAALTQDELLDGVVRDYTLSNALHDKPLGVIQGGEVRTIEQTFTMPHREGEWAHAWHTDRMSKSICASVDALLRKKAPMTILAIGLSCTRN